MSFRTAYYDSKRNKRTSTRELIRDRTPEQERRMMNEYYVRMRNWTPSNGSKL